MSETCLVTDIQKFAVNDGPGFRTNVFLKGCPLRCAWCHNPETIAKYPELYWKRRLCVQCGACLEACPEDAIEPPVDPALTQFAETAYQKVNRQKCTRCMECVKACIYGALEVTGRSMTVEQILDEVEQDRPFYDNSGGGMTLGGGEPTAHPEFAQKLLAAAKERGLHVCLDTNGFCEWETLKKLAEYADIILYDLKHLDPAKHRQMTGVDNAVILANLKKLLEAGKEVWIRIPVIPGFNDSLQYHKQVAEFLAALPQKVARIDLLPFHNWCQDKYAWLGQTWSLADIEAMDPGMLEIPLDFYKAKGLFASVGGSGFEDAANA